MFEPLEPYPFDPLAGFPRGNAPRPQQRLPLDPLAPQEEDSLLARIGEKALGGIGWVGSVLEKTFGGRAIRGGLGGKPRELLSIIPGSDTLGITDPADRVSGKELLGLKDDDGWGATLAGMGTELALDPGMYFTFGGAALTDAGRIAQKVGALPKTVAGRATTTLSHLPQTEALTDALAASGKTMAELAHEPLGGVLGVGLPMSKPSFVLGTGQGGADFMAGLGKAASLVDTGLRKVPIAGSMYGHAADLVGAGLEKAGRVGAALFDPSALGATTARGAEAAREATAGVGPRLAAWRDKLAGYYQELKDAGDPSGGVLRGVLEGHAQGPVHPAIQKVAQAMRGDFEDVLRLANDRGVPLQELADTESMFAPRYRTFPDKPTKGYGGRQPLVAETGPGRREYLKNVPGGTEALERLAVDPQVLDTPLLAANDYVRRQYLQLQGYPPGDPRFKQGEELVAWARGLDPQHRALGLKVFGNHPLTDAETYFDRAARMLAASDATHGLFARAAEDAAAGGVPLTQALERAGLTGQGGAQTLLDRLNQTRQAKGLPALQLDQLAGQTVGRDVLADATRYLQGFKGPEAVGQIGGALDWMTNLTKAYQTATWPAFHVRNFLSGLWQNWVKGMGEAPGGYLKQVQDAYRLIGGQTLPDANLVAEFARQGLSPEQATQALAREMYAYGVGGHMPHLGREVAGPGGKMLQAGTDLEGFGARIPGESPRSLSEGLQMAAGQAPGQATSWNPLDISGVNANRDLFPAVAGGRHVGDVVEGVNRGSLYLSLRRQGYTPEAAAREVLGAHFDYTRGARTDFEQSVMRRLLPFYTYSRSNIPYQLEQLLTRPGGAAGTVARVAQDLRQQAGFLPENLGVGLAVPLGEEEGGKRDYLTRLDLPPEQAVEWLHGGPRWLQSTMMGLMGQANPAIKAPVEYATGKQFYTGRSLDDLFSMSGSNLFDTLVQNSPASRFITTGRSLANPRTWEEPLSVPLTLGTGVRVGDVDMEKARTQAAREYLQTVLAGQPEISKFETLAARPGMEGYLTPAEVELLRLNKTLQLRAQAKMKGGK